MSVCKALCEAPWASSKRTPAPPRSDIWPWRNRPLSWKLTPRRKQSKQVVMVSRNHQSPATNNKNRGHSHFPVPPSSFSFLSICHCFPACQAQSPRASDYSTSGVHSEGWERVPVLPGHACSHSEVVIPSPGVNGATKCTVFLAGPVSPYVPW